MPKVAEKTKSNRGEQYGCNGCSQPIVAGEKYYEWAFFRSKPTRRHTAHGYPRGSMLTEGKMGQAMSACEDLEDAIPGCDNPADLAEAVQTCIDGLQEVMDEYEEAISNFPNSEEQNRERIDRIQSTYDELDSAHGEVDGEELVDLEDKSLLPHEGDELTPEQTAENEARYTELEGENEEKMNTLRQTVEDALSSRDF